MSEASPSTGSSSADEIFAKFIEGEKKYGLLINYHDNFDSKWQHFRACTSAAAFWKYYECPQRGSHSRELTFCPNATEALLLLSNCNDVKSYQVGDLLKLRADPNCRSRENAETPLHRLIKRCKVKAVKLIIKWGADLKCRNVKGKTPLMTACDGKENQKQLLIVRHILANKTVDLNAWDNEGNSAATLAVRNSSIWTLRELLLLGLSVTSIGRRGPCFSIDDVMSSNNASVFNFTKNLRDHTSNTNKRTGESASDLVDGINWEDKRSLYFESMWKSREEVCFLMIQRKARNETSDGNKDNTATPIVYNKSNEDVDNLGTISPGMKKLVLKKVIETTDENESEEGKEANVPIMRVPNSPDQKRDKTYLEK